MMQKNPQFTSVRISVLAPPQGGTAHMGTLVGAVDEDAPEDLFSAFAVSPELVVEALTGDEAWEEKQRTVVEALASAPNKKARDAAKLLIPAIVPARFSGTTRRGAECLGRQVVMHDFDGVSAETFDDACERIRAQLPERFLVIHTTATERDEKGWRLRAIELLNREATPEEWERLVKPHMRSVGEHDKQALDIARLLYLPVKTAGFQGKVYEGPRTKLDDLHKAAPVAAASAPSLAPSSPAAPAQTSLSARRALAAKMLGAAWPESGRHGAQRALAGGLCYDGWSESAALEFLCAVCREAGNEERPKREKTVRDTYKAREEGRPYQGWSALEGHVDRILLDSVRKAIDANADGIQQLADLVVLKRTPSEETNDPLPFDDREELPEFPVYALPPVLRDFAVAQAEATQTPVDLSAMLALGACAACVAGKVDVLVRPGWVEGTNLFIVVALPPAERKSANFAASFAPLYEAQKQKADKAAPAIAMKEAQRDLAEQSLKKKRTEYAKLTGVELAKSPDGSRGADLARSIQEEAAALSRIEVPPPPQLVTSDVTMERLAMLLAEQHGRMCCASAEGTLFQIAAGRYAKNGKESFEVLLQGHAGDPLHIDRVGRPGIYVPRPRLTVVYAVQPHVIQALGASETMRGLGLLARFLYSFPASKVGNRSIDARPMPPLVKEKYAQLVGRLANLPTPEELREDEPLAGDQIPTIGMSPEAQALHRALMVRLEPRLHAQNGDLARIGDWAGKLAGSVARIAGVLHIAEHGAGTDIGGRTMENAIAIGEYALAHAARAFGEMLVSPVEEDARALLRWATSTEHQEFTLRGVVRNCRHFRGGGPRDRERASAAVSELVARGIISRAGEKWVVLKVSPVAPPL